MTISKFGATVVSAALVLGFAGIAHADFVKTVTSESQCVAQDGSVMDLNGTKHCLVAVIPAEFQAGEYAGELRGVTQCPEKSVRKTSIGEFCLVALEPMTPKATNVQSDVSETQESTETMAEPKTLTRAEKRAAKKAKKEAQKAAKQATEKFEGVAGESKD